MKGVQHWWGGLSSNQKFFVVVFLIICIWIIRNSIVGAVKGASEVVKNTSESAVLQANGIKASYPDSTYKTMADKLYKAMNGPGTTDEVVFAQFDKLNNDVDFIKLDKAFGVREASDNLFGFLESEDLQGWIKDDMSAAAIAKINSRLKANGVSKRIQ